MTSARWLRLAIAALTAFVITRMLFAYGSLPNAMASHFDGSGRPNGYMAKGPFLALLVLLQASLPAALLSSRAMLGSYGRVNIPHRDYYLAPERRAATLDRLSGLLDWVALMVASLLAAITELTLRANLGDRVMPIAPYLVAAPFPLFMAGWLVQLYRAFPQPPEDHSASMP